MNDWSNRDSYGLPVGSNGSRILAEASLIGVDNFLKEMKVDFIRFVDDFRLFAPDSTTAHYWLTILIERLWAEGLTINKSKTKIFPSNEFKKVISKKIAPDGKTKKEDDEKSNRDKNPFIIIAGYGGTVPTKFRELSEKEKLQLQKKNINKLIKVVFDNDFINSEQFIEIIKIIISSERFEFIRS